MRRVKIKKTRLLKVNTSVEGNTIEEQLQKIMTGESIDLKGRGMIYTERKDGVLPQTNIRTDRFDKAMEALDYVARTHITKRNESIKNESVNESGFNEKSTTTTEPT